MINSFNDVTVRHHRDPTTFPNRNFMNGIFDTMLVSRACNVAIEGMWNPHYEKYYYYKQCLQCERFVKQGLLCYYCSKEEQSGK